MPERNSKLRTAVRRIRLGVRSRIARHAAMRARNRSGAKFVAVTGSSGKSTTAALIAHVLERKHRVRKLIFFNMLDRISETIMDVRDSDEFVVLEAAAGYKGHMAEVGDRAKPHVAVVTTVGLEHYSVFRGKETVAQEKGALVEAVCPGGCAILNADDPNVMRMADRTAERVVTVGRSQEADFRVTAMSQSYPDRLRVQVSSVHGTDELESRLVGEHYWLSIAAAYAAALELGVPADEIREAIADFDGLSCRCEPFAIENGPTFLLDCVKAPWETLGHAFEIIGNARFAKKRIVLGGISDYPGSAKPKYRDAYRAARDVADQVVFLGDNSHRHRAGDEDIRDKRIVEVATAFDLYNFLKETVRDDEIILLKGSGNQHMERAALAFRYDVRCWEDKCGIQGTCMRCGLYEHEFEEVKRIRKEDHRRRKRERRRKVSLLGALSGRRGRSGAVPADIEPADIKKGGFR